MVWWYQAIIWTNDDLLSLRSSDHHLISQGIPQHQSLKSDWNLPFSMSMMIHTHLISHNKTMCILYVLFCIWHRGIYTHHIDLNHQYPVTTCQDKYFVMKPYHRPSKKNVCNIYLGIIYIWCQIFQEIRSRNLFKRESIKPSGAEAQIWN